MIGASGSHGMQRLKLLVCLAVVVHFGPAILTAQEGDPIQKQLEELKQEYAATTQAFELRIAALELQIANQMEASEKAKERTVSTVDLAVKNAAKQLVLGESGQVGAQFQGQVPSEP